MSDFKWLPRKTSVPPEAHWYFIVLEHLFVRYEQEV